MAKWQKFQPKLTDDTDPNVVRQSSVPETTRVTPEIDPAKFIMELKGMLVGDHNWPPSIEITVRGILRTVEQTGKVTYGQTQAIDNIMTQRDRRRKGW